MAWLILNVQNKNGNTPLYLALVEARSKRCSARYKQIAADLIRAGSDINIKNNKGKSALDIIIHDGWSLAILC